MIGRKKTTRHGLPGTLLVCGIFLAFWTYLFIIGALYTFYRNFANESELQTIKGTVSHVSRTYSRGVTITRLTVESDGQTYRIEPVARSKQLYKLQRGDQIVAGVKPDDTARIKWCWELQRNGMHMITYDDTMNYKLERRRIDEEMIYWGAGIALAFLSLAALLRKYFGAWTEKGFLALQASRTPKP